MNPLKHRPFSGALCSLPAVMLLAACSKTADPVASVEQADTVAGIVKARQAFAAWRT